MEPNNQSAEHAPVPSQPEAVQYESRSLDYGERQTEQRERLGGAASSAERLPPAVERQSQPQPPVTQATLPAPQTDDSQVKPTIVPADDTPLVAADEDVIEKEWVDKAKKILSDTRDDPYQREQAVKQLQIEYVRKRYGREIGDPGD